MNSDEFDNIEIITVEVDTICIPARPTVCVQAREMSPQKQVFRRHPRGYAEKSKGTDEWTISIVLRWRNLCFCANRTQPTTTELAYVYGVVPVCVIFHSSRGWWRAQKAS